MALTDSVAPAPTWYARPAGAAFRCAPAPAAARAFHATLPGYAPTALTEAPALAAELGVGRVFVKDESDRFGLPAFKALGASWAVHRILAGRPPGTRVRLVTATDGNHGRAVARIARLLGQTARVFVSAGVHPAAAAAIAAEGAEVTRVAGPYDEAVRRAAVAAGEPGAILVQDTAWPGYEEIPGWIVEGYATLFAEVDDQLAAAGAAAPGLVAVPVGVGSLAQAAVTHYRGRPAGRATALLAVEPEAAACALASLTRQQRVSVTTAETTMAGLNCGTLSALAWPYLRAGLDAAVAVRDADSARAARDLAALGVSSGPCGAAALAGVRAALTGAGAARRRADLAVGSDSTLVLLSTEGAAANPHGAEAAAPAETGTGNVAGTRAGTGTGAGVLDAEGAGPVDRREAGAAGADRPGEARGC
ncbi:pyridoxal-phosphate dependent enzyme [Streptomyces sp. SAJ15]|uniref:pyridoxal-phosphate dependent enzyme n=1 Tax=Streptomyces sp. SAJ15 TaxID=2011095 RepID=UPI00135DCDB7|nr:pyridoxal-phosphate dependent enzyme [Streptomyces sp. SAJ15]TVL93288.1 PLP-dependent lyase/thiolase [Streptomyces sp. SAJ15]